MFQTEKKGTDVHFYITDREARSRFEGEYGYLRGGCWNTTVTFHNSIFGYPDPIFWKNCSEWWVEKIVQEFNLKEVKPGWYSDLAFN